MAALRELRCYKWNASTMRGRKPGCLKQISSGNRADGIQEIRTSYMLFQPTVLLNFGEKWFPEEDSQKRIPVNKFISNYQWWTWYFIEKLRAPQWFFSIWELKSTRRCLTTQYSHQHTRSTHFHQNKLILSVPWHTVLSWQKQRAHLF